MQVDAKVVQTFESIVKNRAFRCAVLKINEAMTEVNLEKTFQPASASAKQDWDEMSAELPENDCRYVVYDFSYEHQGATKTRVVFILWSPEYSNIRSKMIYAASQEGVVQVLKGVQRQLQCTDNNELEYDSIAKQLRAHTAGY